MRFIPTELAGVVVIEPMSIGTVEGSSSKPTTRRTGGLPASFVQDNQSSSVRHRSTGCTCSSAILKASWCGL